MARGSHGSRRLICRACGLAACGLVFLALGTGTVFALQGDGLPAWQTEQGDRGDEAADGTDSEVRLDVSSWTFEVADNALDLAGAWMGKDGTLAIADGTLEVTAVLTDEVTDGDANDGDRGNGTDADGSKASDSGAVDAGSTGDESEGGSGDTESVKVNPASVRLSIGDSDLRPIQIESQGDTGTVFTFTVKLESLETDVTSGAVLFKLEDCALTAEDGEQQPVRSASLAEIEPFKTAKVTQIEIVDPASSAVRPQVQVLIDGKTADASQSAGEDREIISNAESLKVGVRLVDARFVRLREGDWFADHAFTYQIDGGDAASIAPSNLTAVDPDDGTTYQLDEIAALADEGRHSVSFTYQGHPLLGADGLSARSAASVLIDRTVPRATGIALTEAYDKDAEYARVPRQGDRDAYTALIGPARTLRVSVSDAVARQQAIETSGVASVEVKATRYDDPACLGVGVEETKTFTAEDIKDGAVDVKLDQEGAYPLDKVTITVRDAAGNASEPVTAAALSKTAADSLPCDRIVVDPSADTAFAIRLLSNAGTSSDGDVYVGNVHVDLEIDDVWFPVYGHTEQFKSAVEATFTAWDGSTSLAGKGDQPEFLRVQGEERLYRAELAMPTDADGSMRDGVYKVSFLYGVDTKPTTSTFTIDTTAPVITDIEIDKPIDPATEVAEIDSAGALAVGGARTLRVRIQDLQPRTADDASARVEGMNEGGTAGVDVSGAGAVLRRWLDLHGVETAKDTMELAFDDAGWTEIPLGDEGVYRFDAMALTVPDVVGNGKDDPLLLKKAIGDLPVDERDEWAVDGILVDDPATEPQVGITVEDAGQTPASKDPFYHRGRVDISVSIEDRWFEAYRALPVDRAEFFTAVFQEAGATKTDDLVTLAPSAFVNQEGTDRWTAIYLLPNAGIGNDAGPCEGIYRIELAYRALEGTVYTASERFGIDYTAPSFGALTLSDADPEAWGWIFAPKSETVSLAVTDNLSGIAQDSAHAKVAGTARPKVFFQTADGALADGARTGAVCLAFEEDGEQLLFAGTGVTVEDTAGNTASIASLESRCGSDLPRGAVGIVIDAEAPVFAVSYDNNDALNGHYYKEDRTATLTLTEATFGLVREHDPSRVIARIEHDGSARFVYARDLENPTGDGRTWTAQLAFDRDGDWRWSASFADQNGRTVGRGADAFTVDTTAPVITVAFDNNEASNGMYFNAPRTASIAVRERNFDAGLAKVDTWAKDAAGSAAAVPSATAWQTGDDAETRACELVFSSELHYGFTIACTDLAGNVAEVYEEPEFVIDLTAPAVSISGVEDAHAYAGSAVPVISYSDTNFDPLMATYELSAARREFPYLPAEEADTAVGRTVTFSDFDRTLENDDVYTLTAHVEDLAGNTAEQRVTFSVNRFGSTYMFADAQSDVRGGFLPGARSIAITEINVSGLNLAGTHVELAHDARVRQLEANKDYELSANASSGGWTATTYRLPAELFAKDGYYRIMLTSIDRAGNLSQNAMTGKDANRTGTFEVGFAVDASAPVADMIGLASGGVYLDPAKKAILDVHDNLELESAALVVDGQEVASWKADEFVGDAKEYALTADGEAHTYELVATDRAGNTATALYRDVVITGDWFTFIFKTPILLFGFTAGVIALGGAAVGAGLLVVRHRRRTRDLRKRIEGR